MRYFLRLQFALPAVFIFFSTAHAADDFTAINPDEKTGTASAVVVNDAALVHTEMILPDKTELPLRNQALLVLNQLKATLQSAGSDLNQLVKLNVYVSKDEYAETVMALFGHSFKSEKRPVAVMLVTSPLPDPKALVAVDAVATVSKKTEFTKVDRTAKSGRKSGVAILPRGPVVYISGMASRSKDLETATRETMQQLHGVLDFLGLNATDVIQVKAFMQPIDQAAVVKRVVGEFHQGAVPPPVTYMEWIAGVPTEIELIAWAKNAKQIPELKSGVTHLWPPGQKASPVFSRLAVVTAKKRIYISGLTSRTKTDPAGQVADIFENLKSVLSKSGSDLRHMAKATYYVSADDVSGELNTIRPKVYDPKRPPAASKAMIGSVGQPGRTISIDMIAVPVDRE